MVDVAGKEINLTLAQANILNAGGVGDRTKLYGWRTAGVITQRAILSTLM